MSYYKDLTPFEYGAHECPAGAEVLNVGWLDKEVPFRGDVPAEFVDKLKVLVDKKKKCLYRGFHVCLLCNKDTGNGQIEVEGREGKWYVAPTLIHHYVTAHTYRPPVEFIEAVLRTETA